MKLRDYQIKIIDEVKALIRAGHKSILIRSETGSGKTVLTAFMLNGAAAKGNRSWFNVHRRELIKQSVETFKKIGVDVGVISRGWEETVDKLVQVASIQTLLRRIKKLVLNSLKLCVWDECGHAAADSWKSVRSNIPEETIHIGLSATPERRDGKGLKDQFGVMVEGPSMLWLIENGYLVDYRLFNPGKPDLSKVSNFAGDYSLADAAKVMGTPTITGDAIDEWFKHARGKRTIVFNASIKNSLEVVERFKAAGVPAAHVDGETPTEERDATIEAFRRGEILVLSNVDLFGEGFDVPACECVIMLRPTKSIAIFRQQGGRCLRPVYAEGFDLETKEGRLAAIAASAKPYATIIDNAGNTVIHGLLCRHIVWSLEGREARKRNGDDEAAVRFKNCSYCGLAAPVAASKCKYCDHEFSVESRVIRVVAGKLSEVDKALARAAEQDLKKKARISLAIRKKECKTVKDFEKLGIEMGYNNPMGWAFAQKYLKDKEEKEKLVRRNRTR